MDSTDTDLKKTSGIEQMALIGKMHNMQWLKSNSHLSGHTKTVPDAKEVISNSQKNKINAGTKEKVDVTSTNTVSNSLKLDKVDPIFNKDINKDGGLINKDTHQSPLEVVEFLQKDMEPVWNKNVIVTNTLFPHSQSLVMHRLDEQEMISMSLAENILTVQMEQFRINEEENGKSNELHNDADNEWDNVDHNISDVPKSDTDVENQVSQMQCHDNNNNNAKSKSQSASETKKGMQKTVSKISAKKLNDPKFKRQTGTSLKESYIPSKQGSKLKDDLVNLCNDSNSTSTPTDSKKVTVGTSSKFVDKYGKVNGYSKNVNMGKGTRMKEQPFCKQNFSTLNDSGNRNRSSIDGLDEKSKSVITKLKSTRNESEKKCNDIDDTKRCHKVQVTRTQSYNVHYHRNKPLIKPQQRYLRNATKTDENCSINNSTGSNNNISMSNLTENVSKKKCEIQQPVMNKHITDAQSMQNTSGKSTKNSNVPECSISEKSSIKPNPLPCKRNYQNLSNTKNTIDRNIKDDSVYTQKFKKDPNVYRRSSGILHTYFKDINGKMKMEDHKRNVTDNNLTKDYVINRVSSVDAKMRPQFGSSRITVYPYKRSSGANIVNKTDTLDSTTVSNVQSVKLLNSCSSNTKDSTAANTSIHTSEEPQVLQASCNEIEVQFAKTEQEDTSNNNSNNKANTNNSETKSVKFSDNVQEFNKADHSAISYSDNSTHQGKFPANSLYSNLQNASTNNAQQIEHYQTVQNKNYFDNNNAQYNNTSLNVQTAERDLHLLNMVHQKLEQTSQNVLPQHICSPTITMGNSSPYQNMPTVYLNQYNNTQSVPRKTADSTIIPQNILIPSTSSYTVDSHNMMQNDPSNILMHNTQTSVLPPPGFHNHPITTQHNQWNMPAPEMFLFGNVINPAHPLNMPIQNSRHMCNAEFNNMQQSNYLQHPPLFYIPPLCMQGWNPLLQYQTATAPFQNPTYSTCNTYPNQVLQTNNMTEPVNCQAPTSMQNNPYKYFQHMQHLDNSQNFSIPMKLDNYIGNVQGCKSNSTKMKDNNMDVQMRAGNQYRVPVPNEYQNCSSEGQLMIPFSYAVTMDSIPRNGLPNMHMPVNQKYMPRTLATAPYPRMVENCLMYQNNQDGSNRKDDVAKNDSDSAPPMVSPRECMYYGANYPRKADMVQNASVRQDTKPVAYMHSVNSQHYVPQFQKNATYHVPVKELSSRITMGRGMRRTME